LTPEVRYARSEDVNIAYQAVGEGPLDLVLVPGFVSNIELFWEEPHCARFLRQLASFSRLILFDKRGTGLSDRVPRIPALEERMDDVRAVLDAVGSERAALVGYSEGGPMCALFAATYPQRTTALIMIGSYARGVRAPDYPIGVDAGIERKRLASMEQNWGNLSDLEEKAPSVAHDERYRQWRTRFLRMSASPKAMFEMESASIEIDVRHVLPSIQVPTLVLHAKGDRCLDIAHGRYLAAHIPGAKLVEIDSDDHLPWLDGADVIIENLQTFLTGTRPVAESDRVLATIMFTDIVDSTKSAAARGDRDWRDLLVAHHNAVRRELGAYHGRELDTNGDGFVAAFDGPARAVQCAAAIRESVGRLDLDIRVGLHTGECLIEGDTLSGLAMHIAARVASLAPSGNIVVSRTVKDLVAGSGIDFEDFGTHTLKGVPDDWQLYRVSHA
jgi:pimeloyl-ACP methyl ester carboxylesterase/class 3 adenylate cyclase